MKQPIFIEILNVLNNEELKRFGEFLNSPFYNKRKSIIKLFELCLKAINERNFESLSKESIAHCVYNSELTGVVDDRIRRLLSDFTALQDKFLTQLEFYGSELAQEVFLVEGLRKRRLQTRFRQKISKANEKLEGSGSRAGTYYRDKISLLQSLSAFERESNPNLKHDIDQQINDALDNFFLFNKLLQFHVFYSNQYIHKERQYNWTLFNQIKGHIEENLEEIKRENPEIFLRYRMLCLLLNPQDKSIIDECISYIEDFRNERSVKLDSYYNDILHLCSLMINSGDAGYNEKIVQISKRMELNDVWKNTPFLGYAHLKVIIEAAIITKDFLWAKQFLLSAESKIEPEFRVSFTNLMLSKMFFFTKDFDNARIHQSRVRYEDFIFYTDAKGIEARIEFETQNYTRASEAVETLKKYLRSHKSIPDNWNISFSKFAASVTELIKYTEKENRGSDLKFEIEKIKNEIENSGLYVYGTEWLLDKFNELSKNKYS